MSEAQKIAAALGGIEVTAYGMTVCDKAAAELRRLAAVEQELVALKRTISEAEPKGWLCERTEFGKVVQRCIAMNPQEPPKDHRDSVEQLYTLKGIKK